MTTVLITGAAGFIGNTLSLKLIQAGLNVVGVDNLNDYYDVALKEARIARLSEFENFHFIKQDIADRKGIEALFKAHQFDYVVNLAAQAGVRYSIENPHAYIDANVVGFCNILEGCRHQEVKHLVYASTSSVYGANTAQPFSEHGSTEHPLALYAATKKANELMAHSYASLYKLPCTGLRFFTVYGPWGRPDMALFKFTKAILAGTPIDVYNNGEMTRDFTYVDDIVEGISRLMTLPATANPDWDSDNPDPATSNCPYRICNIGNNRPTHLAHYIETLESELGIRAIKNNMPMQAGDVPSTCADVSELQNLTGYKPETSIETGIRNFVKWYRAYYL